MSFANEIADVEGLKKVFDGLDASLNKNATDLLKLIKVYEDLNMATQGAEKSADNLGKAQKATSDAAKQKLTIDKQIITTTEKLTAVENGSIKPLLEKKIALQEATKALTDEIKAEQAAEGSLTRMRQKLAELTKEYDNAGVRTKAAANEINDLSTRISKAEEATNRHQRSVGGYKKAITDVAKEFLGFAGVLGIAIAVVDKLKDAFGESDAGVRFFSKIGQASKTFFNNIISGNTMFATSNALIASQLASKLDDLRKEEREEMQKVAIYDNQVKMIRLKAATTKDLTEQQKLYKEADEAENKSIEIRKEHLTKEIETLGQLSMVRQNDSELLNELAQKKTALIMIEGDKNIRVQTKIAATAEKIEAEREKREKDAFDKKVAMVEKSGIQEQIGITKQYEERKISEDQYKDLMVKSEVSFLTKKQALYKKDSKEWAEIELEKQNVSIKAREEILKDIKTHFGLENSAERAAQKESDKRAEEKLEGGLKSNKAYLDAQLKQAKEEEKTDDDLKKKKADNAKAIRDIQIQMGRDVVNAVFEANNQKYAEELNRLGKEKDAKLKNANLTAAQKASIEAEYAKKEAAVKTKQAQSDKTKAIFDIAINTAVAVMANAKNPVLIPWVIALGVLEATLVAARPIPKFKDGTKSAPSRGIFGEAGAEIMFPVSGGAIIADKPTYFDGDKFKGARIYSNPETERLIGSSNRNVQGQSISDERILKGLKSVESAILNKPVILMDENYRAIGTKTPHSQTVILNRLLRNN